MSNKIVLERTYRANVEDLWSLWTTKEGFESWWGPQGYRVEVSELDARAGGPLAYAMIAHGAEQIAAMKKMGQPLSHVARGTYTEVRRHERIVIKHLIDFVPGVKPYDNTAVIEFFSSGNSVRMVVTVDPYHDDHMTKMATLGWTSQLTKLDERFAA